MKDYTGVIVVGAGNWGKNLIRNFYDLEALVGVAEVNTELREKTATAYPDIITYADFAAALSSDVSAVVIATPAPTHYQLAMTALQAGKDVFVEKPITLRTDEARTLAEYAQQQGRILMVGHLLLYQPAITWMRDYLASGKAGRVLHVATQRLKLGKVRREENVWWSFAPHDVSVVLDLLGNPPLEKVQATGQAMLQPGIADNVHVDLSFAGGKTAHIHCSWYHPVLQRNTVVITEKQMLVYDEVSQQVTVYEKGVDANLQNRDEGSWNPQVAASEPLKIECQHFLDCLATRQQPRSDGGNGVAVVEILEKAQEAMDG
ncbi:MAG: Gfo/Idh/MocA family oxidoreductase [Nostocaceae cyanobacterium]|nr:Gfo/Idh/MocA family oxidoreductase [Nostocaceae cyanobacterium]